MDHNKEVKISGKLTIEQLEYIVVNCHNGKCEGCALEKEMYSCNEYLAKQCIIVQKEVTAIQKTVPAEVKKQLKRLSKDFLEVVSKLEWCVKTEFPDDKKCPICGNRKSQKHKLKCSFFKINRRLNSRRSGEETI